MNTTVTEENDLNWKMALSLGLTMERINNAVEDINRYGEGPTVVASTLEIDHLYRTDSEVRENIGKLRIYEYAVRLDYEQFLLKHKATITADE